MMRKYEFWFVLIVCLVSGFFVSAQNTIVSSDGTVNDKFSKKLGNLRFSATTIKFGRIKNNEVKNDVIRIFNSGSSAITLSLEKIPAHISAKLQSATIAPNSETSIVVVYEASKKNDFGFVLDRFELLTNDIDVPKKVLSITATIEEYFPPMTVTDSLMAPGARWKETTFDYGRVKAGDKIPHDFVVYNDGKKDLIIHRAKTNCGCLKATISKTTVAPGDSSIVKVDFDSFGKEGKDSRKIDVFVNDYKKSCVTIEFKGEVTK